MRETECGRGHIYDADIYPTCPYCNKNNFVNLDGVSAGQAVNGGVTVGPGAAGGGVTMAPEGYGGNSVLSDNVTKPPVGYEWAVHEKEKEAANEKGKTVALSQLKMNIIPVVGWLVCVDGTEKGKDYRLYNKINTIGRSSSMDVRIEGDRAISRENHARLAYDYRSNSFNLIPGDSTNNIYINGKAVYTQMQLSGYDLIELGETKLLFVPFCCEKFKWDEAAKEANN